MANRGMTLRAALAATTLLALAGPARAMDGMVLRAVGFFEAQSSGNGECTVPSISSGIPVSSDAIGLSNTFGIATAQYPQSRCQGWMELQNNMTAQGISLDRVSIKLRIAGAGRFRQFVPTRNGFPTACRQYQKSAVFTGAHLFPFGSSTDNANTGAGVEHIVFVNLFPMVDAQVFNCLRQQYAGLPSDLFVAFPLVIRAVATGVTDAGESVRSNPISFTLSLQHFCGNGRVDNNEQCDPNAPDTCGIGPCDTSAFTCRGNTAVTCQTDADCQGMCLPEGDPMECTCLYN